MNRVRKQQETVIRAARSTLGQIKNPFELPQWWPELRDRDVLRQDFIAGLTVALVLAEPVPGTFTPGTGILPGDPTDPNRTILNVAADLRALAADLPVLWARYRP